MITRVAAINFIIVIVIAISIYCGKYFVNRDNEHLREVFEEVAPLISDMDVTGMRPSLAGPGHVLLPDSYMPKVSGVETVGHMQVFLKDGAPMAIYYGSGARDGYVYMLDGWSKVDLGIEVEALEEIDDGFYRYGATD